MEVKNPSNTPMVKQIRESQVLESRIIYPLGSALPSSTTLIKIYHDPTRATRNLDHEYDEP